MLIYKASDLFPMGYTDSDFQTDRSQMFGYIVAFCVIVD
jgi:hypothetical protein